jgi:hypothetical protein
LVAAEAGAFLAAVEAAFCIKPAKLLMLDLIM